MSGRYLTDLASVVRSAGLPTAEMPDWQSRARSAGGYLTGRPNTIMVHHTASPKKADGAPDANYMCYSAPAKPIANILLDRTGLVWILAAGCTNTNGVGTDTWGGGVPDNQMNSYAIGIEAGNDGIGEPWPQVQQVNYVRLCRVLCDHYGIRYHNVRAHFEYAPTRKVDPAGPSKYAAGRQSWRMDPFRSDVSGSKPPTPQPPKPTPGADKMATAILHIPGRHAQFIGTGTLLADGTVHCVWVSWFGPGESDFFADHSTLPDLVHQDTLPDTLKRDIILLGNPEEINDSTGGWSASDFYRVIRS